MKNIKKLNAVVAITQLQFMQEVGKVPNEQYSEIASLCERLINTQLYKDDGEEQDYDSIQHAIKLIEEYLEGEGV